MNMEGKYGKVRAYGPPEQVKRKPYSLMLEILETQANKKNLEEYKGDIHMYMSELESTSAVNSAMIDLQPEIQWFMRPFLIDFLIELHASFRLQPQTLYLCMNIIDRYCARRIVFKRHYQLVGCTALWIAGKYEDKKSRVPTLKELAMMCRNAYDEEMFVQMEMHILATLDWSLSHPTLEESLQLSIRSCGLGDEATPCKYNSIASSSVNSASKVSAVTAIGRFLCELSLYDKFFMSVPTSLVAITANLLACSMLQLPNAYLSLKSYYKAYNEKSSENINYRDEDLENIRPEVVGPFICGFDSTTIESVRRISLSFIIQLNRVTEVLSKKYSEVGVTQVVRNFMARFHNIFTFVYENKETIAGVGPVIHDEKLKRFADIVLQLDNDISELPDESVIMPLTPPSATSQFSLFSDKNSRSIYNTPIHAKHYNCEHPDELSSTGGSSKNNWSSPISGTRIEI